MFLKSQEEEEEEEEKEKEEEVQSSRGESGSSETRQNISVVLCNIIGV
jgi:hypothetical protein